MRPQGEGWSQMRDSNPRPLLYECKRRRPSCARLRRVSALERPPARRCSRARAPLGAALLGPCSASAARASSTAPRPVTR